MNFNDWPEIIFDELIESVSETQKYRIEKMVLINTSDVYDGKVLNHKYVDTNDIPGQSKKSFNMVIFYIAKLDLQIRDMLLLILIQEII